MRKIILFIFVLLLVKGNAQKINYLFNKKAPDKWYVFLQNGVGDQNPDSAFIFERNDLYITGKSVGYICTQKEYKDFRLTLQFKWGEKKYPPRLKDKRDSGVLYYFAKGNKDKIWPKEYECQIQEGDCGDFWIADSLSLKVNGKKQVGGRIIKLKDAEKPNGQWNTIEIIALHGKLTHKVNGVIVNEGTDANVRKGKVAIQTEAAEMYYRNIRLEEL